MRCSEKVIKGTKLYWEFLSQWGASASLWRAQALRRFALYRNKAKYQGPGAEPRKNFVFVFDSNAISLHLRPLGVQSQQKSRNHAYLKCSRLGLQNRVPLYIFWSLGAITINMYARDGRLDDDLTVTTTWPWRQLAGNGDGDSDFLMTVKAT